MKVVVFIFAVLLTIECWAESAPATQTPGVKPPEAERVNVETLKQKYWERGETTDLRVVQNRLYKKAQRFEFGILGGTMGTDPFLTVKEMGVTMGYHFSELIGIGLTWWRSFPKDSSAVDYLHRINADALTNPPRGFMGGELALSPIYGKISLLGSAIIHYDLHLAAGVGSMDTDSGKYLAPALGIGQQFYMGKHLAMKLDYRYVWYTENAPEDQSGNYYSRSSSADVITLGFSVLFGFFD